MEQASMNEPFSMAMSNNQRVNIDKGEDKKKLPICPCSLVHDQIVFCVAASPSPTYLYTCSTIINP